MPALLDRMRADFTASQDRYRALETLIQGEDRDPSEIEQAELDSLGERLRTLQPRIQEAADLEHTLSAGATAFASLPAAPSGTGGRRPQSREPRPEERFRSWGEYAAALMTPGAVPPETWVAVEEIRLAYELGGVDGVREVMRAIVDVTTADVAGLLPPAWITTIAETINTSRPFVDAFTTLPLPDTGMTLSYPKIVTRPLVGKQTTEKTDVASRKVSITQATSSVVTYGGGEDVSVQVLRRSDPAYLGLMLELYAEQMAIAMDTDAVTAAEAAITTAAVALSAAAPNAWAGLIADAIGAMSQASRLMPDVFVAGTTMWAKFAGAADTTGRPLFPNVSPMNPLGSLSFSDQTGAVRGLTFVVDPQMAATHGIIGNRAAFTTFLGGFQTMNVDNPTKLGVDYAVFEFAALASRRPDAAIKLTMGA